MTSRVVAGAYVAIVAALTAAAFWSDAEERPWTEVAAAVLTLPTVVVALPAIYLLGALAWNVSDAAGDGPMWPVTLTFTTLMTVVACGNVLLVRVVRTWWTRSRGSGS